jgi:hypothetical protein
MNTITHHKNGGMSITGQTALRVYAATVLMSAIKLYIKSGMKVNRAYTPANMLATASQYTGKTYKRGQLQLAFDDLRAWCDEQHTNGTINHEEKP